MGKSETSSELLSNIIIYMKYAKYNPELGRRETWGEIVDRNKQMYLDKFPDISDDIEEAYKFVYRKEVLPSMRSLQFGGKPIELNPARLYNCSYMPMDHTDAFSEVMFLLLSGCGVGYSVQRHHVALLPEIRKPLKKRRFLVGDSIEGWSDAVKTLIRSYTEGRKSAPVFDFSDIRPKGSVLKTSGGRAPGPEPLKRCLYNIQLVLDRKRDGEKLSPLEVHDINCYIAHAVVSGGIRRSAMISLFSFEDNEMLTCKMGNEFDSNPQRTMANNSVVLLHHLVTRSDFDYIWDVIKASGRGEPGIFFSHNCEWGINPCAEISMPNNTFCNLTAINLSSVTNQDKLNKLAKAASLIGTLQTTFNEFHYLREVWNDSVKKEALIGVSLSGIATGGISSLDLTEAAKIVVDTNKEYASKLGVNTAARCTCVKPDGTAQFVLGTSSGVHAWAADYYIVRLRLSKTEPLYEYCLKNIPDLVEDDFYTPESQAVVSLPQKAPDNSITKREPAIDLLNRVLHVANTWINTGHNNGHNRNNVSTTVTIKDDEWDLVADWMWKNRHSYTALSVLPFSNVDYKQLPFEEISQEQYYTLLNKVRDLDFTKISEGADNTTLKENVACSGNSCEMI